jgi:hypothetical protein
MDHDREQLNRLVALLEEHAIIPAWESLGEGEWGHPLIYERVRATPFFPMSVNEVRRLLEPRAAPSAGGA